MDVRLVGLDELIPYARNPRKNAAAVAKVVASIREFGFRQPIVVGPDMVIVAGHSRYEAARRLGLTAVPVHVIDDLQPRQLKAYRLMDNRSAAAAEWDEPLLSLELEGLAADHLDLGLTGFEPDELDRLLARAVETVDDDRAGDDAIPEPAREPVTRSGDLWLLGEHRLLCGDRADPAAVAKVMAGERASLLFTSPPYANQRDYTTGGIADWDALMQGVFAQVLMADDGQVLVNLSGWCTVTTSGSRTGRAGSSGCAGKAGGGSLGTSGTKAPDCPAAGTAGCPPASSSSFTSTGKPASPTRSSPAVGLGL